jgi:hypothetical protein
MDDTSHVDTVRTPATRSARASLLLLILLAQGSCEAAALHAEKLFVDDARLQRRLIVRVSRMPVADLLLRIGSQTGVRLVAEGDDVADQKLDLYTHGAAVTAADILAAIPRLFNAGAPPRGFRWERSGPPPGFRYALVRDVASRQWEAEQAAAAEGRMPRVLRERFGALGREPLRPGITGMPEQLPSMRKLLPLLTAEQFAQLCEQRYLDLPPPEWTAAQKALWRQLMPELVADYERREPERTGEVMAQYRSPDDYPNPRMEVLIRGAAPRWIIEVGVSGPASFSELRLVGYAEDRPVLGNRTSTAGRAAPALAPAMPDPVFALPRRSTWLMADVLADIAARGKVNLIADDYTHVWTKLRGHPGARPLSAWLALIRDEMGFAPVWEGAFLCLRDRAWFLDRRQELSGRLVARWHGMLRGSNRDRFAMLVEIARQLPFAIYGRLTWDRLQRLEASPELAWSTRQDGARTVSSFFGVISNRHFELLLYDRMPPARQQQVFGAGLTITWPEIPADLQQLLRKRAKGIKDPAAFSSFRIFIRFEGDRLQIDREFPAVAIHDPMELLLPAQPAEDTRLLVGRPLPELEIEPAQGTMTALRPRGPLLLYVTPAWPSPFVAERESFADLRALQRMDAGCVQVVATGATAAELAVWWRERGLEAPPMALRPEAAQQLGAHFLPLALVLDGAGRVTWVKEGYESGDEGEWRRQLARAGSQAG